MRTVPIISARSGADLLALVSGLQVSEAAVPNQTVLGSTFTQRTYYQVVAWWGARLAEARKKVDLQADLIQFDLAEPLRSRFVNYAHNLLAAKEVEIAKLLTELFPPGHGLRISIDELVRASAPVVRVRQTSNFIRNPLPSDQAELLQALRDLPGKWLRIHTANLPNRQITVTTVALTTYYSTTVYWLFDRYKTQSIVYEVGDKTDRKELQLVAKSAAGALMEVLKK